METMVSVAPSGRVKRIFLLLPNPQGVALGYPVRPLQGGMKVSGQALSSSWGEYWIADARFGPDPLVNAVALMPRFAGFVVAGAWIALAWRGPGGRNRRGLIVRAGWSASSGSSRPLTSSSSRFDPPRRSVGTDHAPRRRAEMLDLDSRRISPLQRLVILLALTVGTAWVVTAWPDLIHIAAFGPKAEEMEPFLIEFVGGVRTPTHMAITTGGRCRRRCRHGRCPRSSCSSRFTRLRPCSRL